MTKIGANPLRGRVLALQPRMSVRDIDQPLMATEDPLVFKNVLSLIRVWASGQRALPDGFVERAEVRAVSRQPMIFVTAEFEIASRTANRLEEPFAPGQTHDPSTWPTPDLFRLVPVRDPTFPVKERVDRVPIAGQQEVHECERCRGAGASACPTCDGGGRVACQLCSGTQRRACPQCGGAGTHVGVSGRWIQCRRCRTVGTIACDACNGGEVACASCQARGLLQCPRCQGHGSVRTRWELTTTTSSQRLHELTLGERWPLPDGSLVEHTDVLWEVVWGWPQASRPIPVDELTVPRLREAARKLVEAGLFESSRPSGESRVSAARLRVRGSYAYDVTLSYDGADLPIYIAGTECEVVPRGALPKNRNPLRFLWRWIARYFRSLASDDVPWISKEYVQNVVQGRAHLADDRCLVPAVTAVLNCKAEVTAEGYQIYVVDKDAGEVPLPMQFQIAIDVDDDGTQVLRATHVIGAAHRDKFPAALMLSHELLIGRIAVVKEASGECFALVDCRPYISLGPETYSLILRALAAEARRLESSDLLE